MQLLFKHSSDLIRFVKCFAKKQRKLRKAARRKKDNRDYNQSFHSFKFLLLFWIYIWPSLKFIFLIQYFYKSVFYLLNFIQIKKISAVELELIRNTLVLNFFRNRH